MLNERRFGSVRYYDSKRGFGFVIPENGDKDIFFHITQFEEEPKAEDIKEGLHLGFEVIEKKKGLQAINISMLTD